MLHPDFIKRTQYLLHDEYDTFDKALDSQPPVSIRINPHKFVAGETISGAEEAIPWSDTGRYLQERPSFTFDPLFHAGTYYVQEASSMFIEQAVKRILNEPDFHTKQPIVLDLCAAPGGKSTHTRSLLPENSLLVCNEVIRSRSMILAENMSKWGIPGYMVTNNDPKAFGCLTHFFDIVIADLPCSGEGMFRKDSSSRDEWSIDNVKLCASRQRRIIHDVWDAIKPGGWLIYSTCTFNTEENEDNVHALAEELGAEICSIPVKEEWNISGALKYDIPAYRFFPHRTRGEGFFLVLMCKNGEPTEANRIRPKHKDQRQPAKTPPQLKQLLSDSEKFVFLTDKNTPEKAGNKGHTGAWSALLTVHENSYALLAERLNILSAGISLGEFKGKDFIPAVSLALSTKINTEAFPTAELSNEQAISYLQREAIAIPEGTPKGYILVTYKNTPLGFVKNIGNRANNLYPQEWRIRNRKQIF